MKSFPVIMLLLICMITSLNANVVINELLYDPVGDDTGYEWLELYNCGTTNIELEGAQIQTGGSAFTTIYTFPHYILRPGRYLLIGEDNITQAVLITPLAMQNGGSETDGVRFVSADGEYTDTVLYDEPNANQLPDDTAEAGSSFAADVAPGCSLSRRADGFDTDACHQDFVSEANPTPGTGNTVAAGVDYALVEPEIYTEGEAYYIDLQIVNQSIVAIDTLVISLRFSFLGEDTQCFDIQPFPVGNALPFSTGLSLPDNPQGVFQVMLECYSDCNPANNTWAYCFGQAETAMCQINEVMYNPATDNQEWIELTPSLWGASSHKLTLEDASGNHSHIEIPANPPEYLVICKDKAGLLSRYPSCPPENVLEVSSLPSLNNEGDTVYLIDSLDVVVDSMAYTGNNDRKDYSLEKQVEADSTASWHYSYAAGGATPGAVNSVVPPPPPIDMGSVKVVNSPFNPLAGESLRFQYNFRDDSNTLSCTIFDLNGRKRCIIADWQPVFSSGEIVWNGRDKSGKALPRGIYILYVEAVNSDGKHFLHKQLTIVLATK